MGLMLTSTLFPHSIVRIMGRPVPSEGWWTSGAGPTMLVVAGLFLSASVMMILRARHARFAYVLACIAISISIPYVFYVTGGSTASLPKFSLTINWLLTVAIGLYLFLSRGTLEASNEHPWCGVGGRE